MKKRIMAVLLGFILIVMQCGSLSVAIGEDGANILAGIEYTSIAQAQGTLFFQGEYLYAYDAVDDRVVKAYEEPMGVLCPEAQVDDLMLVNGGSELHALDISNGKLYKFAEGIFGLVGQLQSDIFQAETDPLVERRFSSIILTQASNGEVLYLLVTNEDQPTEYDVVYFNLDTGASGLVRLENVIFLTQYKDGKLAAAIEQTDIYRIVEIDVASHKMGNVLYEEKNPKYRMTGMAYDVDTDRLIVVTGRGIYRIADHAMIDLYAYLPQMDERDISMDYNCFLDGKLIFVNQHVFYTSDLMGENAAKSLRFGNSGVSNKYIRGFIQQNPEVQVSFHDGMVWNTEEIINSLLSLNSDIDVISLYAGAGLTAMKNKKYYADLSSSNVLAEDIDSMYPQIREILVDGDNLIAYPCGMSVNCWLIDDEALLQMGYQHENATMKEWLDFVEEYAISFNAEESAHALFPLGFTRRDLVGEILEQYIIEYESVDQLNFRNPELKSILERILKLPKSIFLTGDTAGATIDTYDGGIPPLFIVNSPLSPDAYVGFYEQYEPKFVLPPAFSLQNQPRTKATLSVYLINPYSKNKETAVEFLEYCARHADPLLRFYVEQEYDQPIPDPDSVELKVSTLSAIDDLNNRLETADIEDRADIEVEMNKQKIILDYAIQNEWLVSQSDITMYKTIVPNITFLPNSLCYTDSTCSVTNIGLSQMKDMIMANNMDIGDVLATAERKYEMMQMETN